jgi:hypothetical protein
MTFHVLSDYNQMMVYDPITREADSGADTPPDRRRSGRDDDVNVALIPPLRASRLEHLSNPEAEEEEDPLAGARGIIVWALLSIVFWTLVAGAIWTLNSRIA